VIDVPFDREMTYPKLEMRIGISSLNVFYANRDFELKRFLIKNRSVHAQSIDHNTRSIAQRSLILTKRTINAMQIENFGNV
jgi:hypothetical protein